jgi:hypothetical protein
VSEYQCYEFVALDRPLTSDEMAELRSISTRADISPTRFWNEYHWSGLKADPKRLLARYFDAFLYFANWASHRFMLRFPASQVDWRQLKPYFPGGPSTLAKAGKHLVVDLWSDQEPPLAQPQAHWVVLDGFIFDVHPAPIVDAGRGSRTLRAHLHA